MLFFVLLGPLSWLSATPEITSFEFTPSSTNNESSQPVLANLQIQSDAPFSYAQLALVSPGAQVIYFSVESTDRIEGSETGGLYSVEFIVATGAEIGEWTVKNGYISDVSGAGTGDPNAAMNATFTVTGAAPTDTSGPTISDVSLMPPTVGNDGTGTITLDVTIADPAGFEFGVVSFVPSAGIPADSREVAFDIRAENRTRGTAENGTYRVVATVESGTPPGSYVVSFLQIEDRLGLNAERPNDLSVLSLTIEDSNPGEEAVVAPPVFSPPVVPTPVLSPPSVPTPGNVIVAAPTTTPPGKPKSPVIAGRKVVRTAVGSYRLKGKVPKFELGSDVEYKIGRSKPKVLRIKRSGKFSLRTKLKSGRTVVELRVVAPNGTKSKRVRVILVAK